MRVLWCPGLAAAAIGFAPAPASAQTDCRTINVYEDGKTVRTAFCKDRDGVWRPHVVPNEVVPPSPPAAPVNSFYTQDLPQQVAPSQPMQTVAAPAPRPAGATLAAQLEQAVRSDSQSWFINRFDTGSVSNVRIVSAKGEPMVIRGDYRYNGGAAGWVEARVEGDGITCLQFWDTGHCTAVHHASAPSSPARETSIQPDRTNTVASGQRKESKKIAMITHASLISRKRWLVCAPGLDIPQAQANTMYDNNIRVDTAMAKLVPYLSNDEIAERNRLTKESVDAWKGGCEAIGK